MVSQIWNRDKSDIKGQGQKRERLENTVEWNERTK